MSVKQLQEMINKIEEDEKNINAAKMRHFGGRKPQAKPAPKRQRKPKGGNIDNFAGMSGGTIDNFAGMSGGTIDNFAGMSGGMYNEKMKMQAGFMPFLAGLTAPIALSAVQKLIGSGITGGAKKRNNKGGALMPTGGALMPNVMAKPAKGAGITGGKMTGGKRALPPALKEWNNKLNQYLKANPQMTRKQAMQALKGSR